MTRFRHRFLDVDGRSVFARQAGDPSAPAVVLLHGYPTSSRQYVRLMDRLAGRWHVVAPDLPGFGLSEPLPGTPTFDALASVIGAAVDELGIDDYAMYVFDYGAPVGFRIALAHDLRVRAVISQNGNAYLDGFGAPWQPIRDAWDDRAAFEALIATLTTLDGTRGQWLSGARDPEHVDPEQYRADQAVLDLPGRAAYQRDLLWDYRTNPQRYPQWQEWLRRRRPDVLAVWGRRDPWFVPAGAEAFRRDVPDAEIALVDSGHFALEEELDPIATLIEKFLERTFP